MFILTYILKTAFGLILFYLLYTFILKKNSSLRFNRYYLLISLVSSFILPFIQISYKAAPEVQVIKFLSEQRVMDAPNFVIMDENIINPNSQQDIIIQTEREHANALNFISILKWFILGLYILGIAFLMANFLYQFWRTLFLIRNNIKEPFSRAKLIQHNLDLMPFSVFDYIVINKNQYDAEELDYVLLHEMEHINQKHSIDIAIIELLKMFFWINPLLWIYEKEIKQNHEYLADRGVIDQGIQTQDYQLILLNICLGVPKYSIVNNFNHSFIKSRIAMMTQKKLKPLSLWKVALIVPVVIAILFACAKPEKSNTVAEAILSNTEPEDFTQYIELNTPYDWVSYVGGSFFCEGTYTINKIDADGFFEGRQVNTTLHANIPVTGRLTKDLFEIYTGAPWREIWSVTKWENGKLCGRMFADYDLARKNRQTFYLAKHIDYDELLPESPNQPGKEISKGLHLCMLEKYFYEIFREDASSHFTGWFMITNYNEVTKEISGHQCVLRSNAMGAFSGKLTDDKLTINIGEPWNQVWNARLDGDVLKGTVYMDPKVRGFSSEKGNYTWIMTNSNHPIISTRKVEELNAPYNLARYSELEQNLSNYLTENMNYPDEAKKDSIQGRVYVAFNVLTDGSIADIHVARKVNPLLDAEAVRLVKLTDKKWVPAMINDLPVVSEYMLPINFSLNGMPATAGFIRPIDTKISSVQSPDIIIQTSQTVTKTTVALKGKVTDKDTKEALASVNVVEIDKNGKFVSGTVTDINGNYVIIIKEVTNSIQASIKGYKKSGFNIERHTTEDIELERER